MEVMEPLNSRPKPQNLPKQYPKVVYPPQRKCLPEEQNLPMVVLFTTSLWGTFVMGDCCSYDIYQAVIVYKFLSQAFGVTVQ